MGESGVSEVKELDVERGKSNFLHLGGGFRNSLMLGGGCGCAPISDGGNNGITVPRRGLNLGESSNLVAKCELPIGCQGLGCKDMCH